MCFFFLLLCGDKLDATLSNLSVDDQSAEHKTRSGPDPPNGIWPTSVHHSGNFLRMSEADTSSRQNQVFRCLHTIAPRPQLVFELFQFLPLGSWISVFRTHARNAKTLQRNHTSFIMLSNGWNAYGFLSDWVLVQPQEFFPKATLKKQVVDSRPSLGDAFSRNKGEEEDKSR